MEAVVFIIVKDLISLLCYQNNDGSLFLKNIANTF